MGEIRRLAARFTAEKAVALALWNTSEVEAQLLAALLLQAKQLSVSELEGLAMSVKSVKVADWFVANLAKPHQRKDEFRARWVKDSNVWLARAGWSLTADLITKDTTALDLPGLLDRIEQELPHAQGEVQWTMNFCLAAIGIHSTEHRRRAVDIGERFGLYRDYPVAKGCTSPFAPTWIKAMVNRAH